MIDAASQYNKL